MNTCCAKASAVLESWKLFDKVESDIDSAELDRRLETAAKTRQVADRGEFWKDVAIQSMEAEFMRGGVLVPRYIQNALENFEDEGIESGVAIDLGCGSGGMSLHLSNLGWKVIAVDNNETALRVLQTTFDNFKRNANPRGSAECVHSSIEDYEFPKNIRLILAKDSLCYCDPSKLVTVWNRAFNALENGGRIVGDFFPQPYYQDVERTQRDLTGAWFTDMATVRALLKPKYTIEHCAHSACRISEPLLSEPRQIEFVGKKE
jgi:SAM-dependent methyltransferase